MIGKATSSIYVRHTNCSTCMPAMAHRYLSWVPDDLVQLSPRDFSSRVLNDNLNLEWPLDKSWKRYTGWKKKLFLRWKVGVAYIFISDGFRVGTSGRWAGVKYWQTLSPIPGFLAAEVNKQDYDTHCTYMGKRKRKGWPQRNNVHNSSIIFQYSLPAVSHPFCNHQQASWSHQRRS